LAGTHGASRGYLLGRWREYRHGAKCYQCDRRTAVRGRYRVAHLCDVHNRELIELRSSYNNSDVAQREVSEMREASLATFKILLSFLIGSFNLFPDVIYV
jgi:hypothetical protein